MRTSSTSSTSTTSNTTSREKILKSYQNKALKFTQQHIQNPSDELEETLLSFIDQPELNSMLHQFASPGLLRLHFAQIIASPMVTLVEHYGIGAANDNRRL